MSSVPIATYEEVKDLPNHPEKLLIDVREPAEIAETGSIPTAINIPCKFHKFTNFYCPEQQTIPLQSESCSTVVAGVSNKLISINIEIPRTISARTA